MSRDLSWNSIKSFDGLSLPSTVTDLYVGGNKITSLKGTFPNTLKLLYVHDLPLAASLSDATLSNSIAYLCVTVCVFVWSLESNEALTRLSPLLLPCVCRQVARELGTHDTRQRQVADERHESVRVSVVFVRLSGCASTLLLTPLLAPWHLPQ